jgi:signal transduction histidine kinase
MAFSKAQRAGRILLVEDGLAAPELAATLAQLGHLVLRAASGTEALARFANDTPDAVLFAVRLPSAAMRATRALLADLPDGPTAPVAFVCPRADTELVGDEVVAGGDDLIGLPLSRPELAARVDALLARRALEDAAAEARRKREVFIAMVVHDLKNPLATIQGNAEYLSQASELSADSKDSVRDLLSSAALLGRVVMELVDVGKGLDRPLAPLLADVELGVLLADLTRAVQARAGQQGVAVALDDELGDLRVVADRDLVRRVLDTLIDNALKHAPRGTTVTVTASAGVGRATVRVHDDGRAIAPEQLGRIFARADDLERGGGGVRSGRRLAMLFCRLVCDAHGGRIWAESAPAGGATFCVELPERPQRGPDGPWTT